jgi:hypothetical protein
MRPTCVKATVISMAQRERHPVAAESQMPLPIPAY